jgi:hypothetical protein
MTPIASVISAMGKTGLMGQMGAPYRMYTMNKQCIYRVNVENAPIEASGKEVATR